MSLDFEVPLDLDSRIGNQVEHCTDVYEGLFEEKEFIALGVNPSQPTGAKPGSVDKVMMLAARYAAGLPLWHDSDCYDHGPGDLVEERM